jgi:hypothetical protein
VVAATVTDGLLRHGGIGFHDGLAQGGAGHVRPGEEFSSGFQMFHGILMGFNGILWWFNVV